MLSDVWSSQVIYTLIDNTLWESFNDQTQFGSAQASDGVKGTKMIPWMTVLGFTPSASWLLEIIDTTGFVKSMEWLVQVWVHYP